MKIRNKTLALVLALCLLPALGACGKAETKTIHLGLLKGPTGMGGVYMLDGAANGSYLAASEKTKTPYDYDITLAAAPTELNPMLINGELDIAALPTNAAAALYNKTKGGVQILALNTKGVLYILENGESVQSVADLAGKTIYATGQSSNPEYVLNHILRSNGLEPGTDVTIEWRESDELSTLMASGEIELCMLPVPAATAVQVKNADVRVALDLTAEWDALSTGSELIMGCIVARTAFIEENPEYVKAFLTDYAASVNSAMTEEGAAALMAQYEIVGAEGIAKKALPYANLCCITGAEEIQASIAGYYDVLFAADPSSIGGAVPAADFYYAG